MMIFRTLLLLALISVFSFCSSSNPHTDGSFKHIDTKKGVELIAQNATNNNFMILDIRTKWEYDRGHLKNSLLVAFNPSTLETELEKFDKNTTYLIYCRTGNRSNVAMNLMKKLGFKQVYNLKGGTFDWSKSGQQLVTNQHN